MRKGTITIFLSNPILAHICKHLSFKNVDKISALLIDLPFNKVSK